MNSQLLRALGFALLVPCVGLAQNALPPTGAQAPEVTLPDPGMMPAPNAPAEPAQPPQAGEANPAPAGAMPGPAESQQPGAPGVSGGSALQPAQNAQPAQGQASAAPAKAPAPAPEAQAPAPEAQAPAPEAQAPATQAQNPETAPAVSGSGSAFTPSRPLGKGELKLNFQNASLADVLNYLSEAAGFVIVQEAPVSGTVTIVSRQPITGDDAVDLLNAVLIEKGFTAIRSGRILKIVNRSDATKKDLPVMTGSDPNQIPKKDGMVTQILPVRYLEVGKLVDNLRPLLAPDASISSNESSNAILMVDTQTNVHRMAEIIRALDTSVSSVSSIRVFPLQYADSKSLATVVTQLFASEQGGGNNNNPMAAFAGFGRRGGFPGFGGMGQGNQNQNGAQRATVRVIAVSDEQSNSVIVSAPDDVMTNIADVISRLDTNIADVTETQIFRLQHADASELADVLNTLYADSGSSSNTNGGRGQGMQVGGWPGFGQPQNNAAGARSQRALLQSRVVAVPDARTNSVIVSAARETMAQIAVTVGRLDSTDANKQHVFVHHLENADPDNVASILRGMFSTQGSDTSANQPSSSRLNQRTTTGATSDGSNILSTNGGSAVGSSGSRISR